MFLSDLTWPAVEAYLQHKDGIIIPIGSTEQHGPTGAIGTDAMLAEMIARQVGDLTQAMVGPVLSIGIAEHHMAFPGTLSLRPTTLIALITDYIASLAHHGFRHFYFVNGHGGNIATLRAAFSEIQSKQRQSAVDYHICCTFINWYDVEGVVALRRKYYGEREGRHATPSEIAVVQYLRSDLIHSEPLPPPVPYQGEIQGAKDFREKYPDGRIAAYSSMANPEQGKVLFDTAVKGIVKQVNQFFVG
ncbi:MAG: creatininase family protein [Sedimenticola thiotaurini]|uniref:Creatininase family protein n=1 Tax=Sedimenticola thiotaurini TaxID=1543721 RepID=A0A558D6N6_9GAMM|nr:MAG: creatininase family protein [Sedimenticola thiotaurini]